MDCQFEEIFVWENKYERNIYQHLHGSMLQSILNESWSI